VFTGSKLFIRTILQGLWDGYLVHIVTWTLYFFQVVGALQLTLTLDNLVLYNGYSTMNPCGSESESSGVG
jgi:hypothetical protein